MLLGRVEEGWQSGGEENLAEMENGGVSCVDLGFGGVHHGNEEDLVMALDEVMKILHEDPLDQNQNSSSVFLDARTSQGDNNAEYQHNVSMPMMDLGSLDTPNNQLHNEPLFNFQHLKEADSGKDSLNFQTQKEVDSGSVYGLQDNGVSSHYDILDTSQSDCLNTSVGDSFQPDDQYETPGSSQSDLFEEFSYPGKVGAMPFIDSLRPQQRSDSVLASELHLPIAESNNSRNILSLSSLNIIGKEGKTFGSIDGNPYQQSSKLDPSNIEKSVSERSCQAPVVDLTQTDSSDEDVEIGVRQFENTNDARRKLPSWGQTTRKVSTNKESKVIYQRNPPFADASDWNHRKAPINAQERRIVGLQFQGTSGVDSNGIYLEKKPFMGTAYQHSEYRFENKQHVKEEWNSGASSSSWKPGSTRLDPVLNQKPTMMDIPYWNNGSSDTEDLHESTNNIRRHLPPTVAPGIIWPKVDDESQTLRLLFQDQAQPISEETPNDGLMAVPLLKHQRIALAWMVQKETNNMNCAGGILADDQGLGKTVSTVALILKERPASQSQEDTDQVKVETSAVDLDDDDFVPTDAERKTRTMKESALSVKKGRPSAGTLVVCPTSVLRQWAQEIRDKVTAKANLSVLVYHGSNRTKDPNELAKYDVVLTTYSIVSMEVPKQDLADDQEDFEKNSESYGIIDAFTEKKKKKSSDTTKKKNKKGVNGVLCEPSARPLAKVGWFRVVLDEAQSIKNHRTQVARACWGLRAKRRWCLSGTPIQNSIDDLYSYFRFLKFDPYASYRSFCTTIKMPISRNPQAGYRKLQAVLKTVMLRRTKGTTIDGEPIVKLPPKTVTLKKVEFSMEEREFYKRLEADSRAQFKVYAAAGTVKQNYVNILLMLLRLRQACDHPLLVKVSSSDSTWRLSADTARKLPREKRNELIYHLEGSLAICGICNDVPEVAVVTLCGHVYCNQCISAHLSQTDDTVCPHQNCKGQLKADLVFSLATLKNSTSEHQNDENFESVVKEPDSNFNDPSATSSKIRAALDTLLALPKFRVGVLKSTSVNNTDKDASSLSSMADDFVQDSAGELSEEIKPDMQPSRKKQVVEMPEKAIVFSQWTSMLDLLEVPLKQSSIQYRRLDGTMSVLARDKAVQDFKTLPEVTVMIMSLKAASLGLNMVAACHVLLLDLWWNPTTEDQAIDRAHRIGQTRPVYVSRFTVKDTVEDRILALQERKREMVASAFGEDASGGRHSHLSEEDLRYLFMGGPPRG